MSEGRLTSLIRGPLIDLETARALLKEALKNWEWLIAHIESERGYVRFPPRLGLAIHQLRIENYPLLYEKEHAAGTAMALAVFDKEELSAWDAKLLAASPSERGREILEFCEALEGMVDEVEWPETEEELRQARARFDLLTADERTQGVRFWQFLLSGFLAQFYDYLSVMVHGERLTALVSQAKTGSPTAFAKAVQIDKRVLTVIPYFKERWDRAHLGGEERFLGIVGPRLHSPPYKGKIRHKSLWLTFAVLDAAGLLDGFPHEALLDFCLDVGAGGRRNRIDDVKNLSKRVAEFRRFRDRGMVIESTP